MKTVLFVARYWGRTEYSGGGELSIQTWRDTLRERGYRVVVWTRTEPGEPVDADIEQKPDDIIVRDIATLLPDAVVVMDARALSKRVVERCRDLLIPCVFRLQWWWELVDAERADLWDRLNDKNADLSAFRTPNTDAVCRATELIVNSEWVRNAVHRVIGPRRVHVEFPPIDLARCRPPELRGEYVLMPSAEEGKGLPILLELAEDRPDLRFVLLRTKPRDERLFGERVRTLPNVEVRGWQEDMSEAYAGARVVFIGTQTAETFCRVAAEARAFGIPILSSDAGNLQDIVDSEAGVVVPRKAPAKEWLRGLNRALAMFGKTKPDTRWCKKKPTKLPKLLDGLTAASGVTFLYPRGAPGVAAACRHWAWMTGARAVEIGEWQGPNDRTHALILCAGMLPEYEPIFDEFDGPIGALWCSHMAQMELHEHEIHDLFAMARRLKGRDGSAIFMTSPEAKVWDGKLDVPARYLAPCIDPAVAPPAWGLPSKHEKPCVALLGPATPRKFHHVALLAATDAGFHVCASDFLRPKLEHFANQIKADVSWHRLEMDEDVFRLLAQCYALVHVSVAETFGYAPAYAMLVGTPVVSASGLPVADYAERELRNSLHCEPQDVVSLAERLRALRTRERAVRLGELSRQHITRLAETNASEARATLREFVSQTDAPEARAERVPVLYLTWNRLEFTKETLPRLLASSERAHIVCWDNGSTDGTREWLLQNYANDRRITLVLCEKNYGVYRPWTTFLRWHSDAFWVAKVDNDTVVPEGWLNALIETAERHQLDLLGCKHPIMHARYSSFDEWMRHEGEQIGKHVWLIPYVGGSAIVFRRCSFREDVACDNAGSMMATRWTELQQDASGRGRARIGFTDQLEAKLLDMEGDNRRIKRWREYYRATDAMRRGETAGSAPQRKISLIVPVHSLDVAMVEMAREAIARAEGADEVIVVDDGSPIEWVAKNGERVVRHKERRGVAASWNDGAKAATARYLAFLNSDAFLTKGNLQLMAEACDRRHPCIVGAVDDALLAMTPPGAAPDGLIAGRYGPLFMIRRDVFEYVGPFDEDFDVFYEDTEYFDRAEEKGVACVRLLHCVCHHSPSQTVARIADVKEAMRKARAIYERKRGLV